LLAPAASTSCLASFFWLAFAFAPKQRLADGLGLPFIANLKLSGGFLCLRACAVVGGSKEESASSSQETAGIRVMHHSLVPSFLRMRMRSFTMARRRVGLAVHRQSQFVLRRDCDGACGFAGGRRGGISGIQSGDGRNSCDAFARSNVRSHSLLLHKGSETRWACRASSISNRPPGNCTGVCMRAEVETASKRLHKFAVRSHSHHSLVPPKSDGGRIGLDVHRQS